MPSSRRSSNPSPNDNGESIIHVPSGPSSSIDSDSNGNSDQGNGDSSASSTVKVVPADEIPLSSSELPAFPDPSASYAAATAKGTEQGKERHSEIGAGLYFKSPHEQTAGSSTSGGGLFSNYVKTVKMRDRALLNSSFKFENSLRDLVLNLSDSLEKLNLEWELDVLNRINKVHPNVAKFVVENLCKSLKPLNTFQTSDPYGWLNPLQANFLESLLKSSQQSLSLKASDYIMEPTSTNFRQTHRELYQQVFESQGNNQSRYLFIQQFSCHAKPSIENQADFSGRMDRIKRILSTMENLLESDKTNIARNLLFQNVAEMICTCKKVWKADVDAFQITRDSEGAWPFVDFLFAPGKLFIQAYIGEGFQVSDLQVRSDGRAMELLCTSAPLSLNKKFELPVLVDKDSISASYRDLILTIKCKVMND